MVAQNGLETLARRFFFALTGLLAIACMAIFGSRLQVNENLRVTIETIASQNAGMAIEVGQVRGTWWGGLTLHDVRVHGTPDKASEVVISAPLIQAGYTLSTIFGASPNPIRLDIYQPDVYIRVRKDRLMNLQPRMRAVHDDPPGEPAPHVEMVFHNGHISYGDGSARKPFVVEVGRVTGSGTLRGFDLSLKLQAMQEADVIHAQVGYDLKNMRGELDAQATALDMAYWVNRFAWAREYEMKAGEADIVAHASWQDPMMLDELKLAGTARLKGGRLKLRNVAVPLDNIAGDVIFDQTAARMAGMHGTLAGMPIDVTGEVRDILIPAPYLGYPDQAYALTVTAPAINLAKLSIPWPGLKSIGLGGYGKVVAKVSGLASAPVVDMVGTVPVGRWGKELLGNVLIDARYVTGRIDLPRFSGFMAGGNLTGSTFVGLPPGDDDPVPYTVDMAFDGLKLPTLLDHYLEEPLMFSTDGRVIGTYHLAGIGGKNRATVAARVTEGRIDGRPVEAATLTWEAADGRWKIPDAKLRWGRNRADFVVEGADDGPFSLKFDLPEGDLAWLVALNPDPPETPVRGTVRGHGTVHGLMDFPKTWKGDMAFTIPEGHVWNERFDRGVANAHFDDNSIVIDKSVARFLKGDIRATGTYGPVIAKRTVEAFTKFDIRLHELDLGAVTALPPQWRDLRGRVQGRFAYVGRTKHYDAAGQISAVRVRHPGWGELERLRASVIMTDTEVSLLPATWIQKGEVVRASGSIQMPKGQDPVLDIHVKTDRASIATLFDAIRWESVMERLAPADSRLVPALGPVREAGALPGRETEPIRTVLVSLGDQLAHWQAHRKLPILRQPPAPTLLPFWEDASGRLTIDAHVTGPVTRPVVDLDMLVDELHLFGRKIDQLEARVLATHEVLRVAMARLQEGGRTVLTMGGAISDNARETLVLRTHGLDLGWLDRVLGPKQMKLTGRADGVIKLRGPFSAPRVEAEGALLAGSFAMPGVSPPLAFDEIQADLAFERGRLWLDRATIRQQGRQASISGSLPVDDRARGPAARLDLALKLEDANLGIVNLIGRDRFRWLGGKGLVDVKVHGTMAKPSLEGRIDLHDGHFEAKGLDGPVEDFEADVVLNDEKVDIRALKGRYGGGGFEVLGEVFWEQFEPRRVNLTALARPFRVRTPDGTYNGMIEANMRLTGPVHSPVLSGQVALWDGVVRIRDQVAKAADASAAPPALKLGGVNVTLGPSLYVRNALMDVSVTTLQRQGHLAVEGTLAAPRPRGVVIVESGTITPLNNPFKITEGRVEFLGERVGSEDMYADILGADPDLVRTGMNGRLDVSARSAVYDYTENETVDVRAHVTGTLDRMEMHFTALPIRSEQEILDILSKKQVLAGTFSGKLDGGEVIVKEVGGFVTSNIEEFVSPLTLRLRNMMNLQTLRFELVSNYEKTSLTDLAGFRPALTMETRPLFERLSLGSRLVAGEFYDTSPNTGNDNNYVAMNMRLNRRLSVEYRVDPYVNPGNQRLMNQTLGLRAQVNF